LILCYITAAYPGGCFLSNLKKDVIMTRVSRFFLTLVLFTTASAQGQVISDAGMAELDRYLEDVVANSRIPGLVAMVTNADGIIYQGAYGKSRVAENQAMTLDSIFNLASMTKPITSLAVMMLVEQGRVDLDEPVETYLPYLANRQVFTSVNLDTGEYESRPASRKMTVRHLLTHTSGLGYAFDSPELARLMGSDFGASATSLPLLHEPGSQWTYGEGTRVLGQLVETVSGTGLYDFLRKNILSPLVMTDTFYKVPTIKKFRVVSPHRSNGTALVEDALPDGDIASAENGDGGLYGDADDYSRFIRLFLNGGVNDIGERLLGRDLLRSMGTDHTAPIRVRTMPQTNPLLSLPFPLGAGEDSYGLGFQVTAVQHENRRAPGSMAWAGIFNTEFWIDPANNIGAVLLMQYLPFYDDEAIEVLQGFEERIYANLQGGPRNR
jgi:methyl acetate hydrolase